ncbi:MAG: hypothetical protein ACRYF4_05090 [Janthinobacterium lividum]
MPHDPPHHPSQSYLRVTMVCAVVCLLAYVGFLAAYSTSGFPTTMVSTSHWPSLVDKPVGEDGYYMLTVADNIATKGRIMYNGGMPATGIQPLATAMFAALDYLVKACGGGTDALIRSVMGLGALLFVVLAYQISRIADALAPPQHRRFAATLAFLLTLSSYTLFRLFTYGLETGFYLLLVAACFQVTLHIAAQRRTSAGDTVLLGLAAGFAGEARIDFGLLFAILLVTLLVYSWITPVKALAAGALALLVVSPWFLFVHHVSGSWLPSSGKAESTMVASSTVLQRAGTMAVAVAGQVMPWCYGVLSHTTVAVALLSTAAAVWFLARRKDIGAQLRSVLLSPLGRLWLLCLFSLVPIYLLLFNATHFYYRYVAPMAVLTIPVCALALVQVGWVRRHLPVVAVALCGAFACWTFGALHTGHVGNSQTIAAGYIHRNFPEAHVGSFQSGVVGFFNPNVENLDGKLNQGALQATAQHQLPAFIDSEHIDVLVDWRSVMNANLPQDYLRQGWVACPVPIVGDVESVCLVRKGFARHAPGKPQG